jgi:hypothetical protein
MISKRYWADRRSGLLILCGIKLFLLLFLTTLSRSYGYVLYTTSIVSIILLKDAIMQRSVKAETDQAAAF